MFFRNSNLVVASSNISSLLLLLATLSSSLAQHPTIWYRRSIYHGHQTRLIHPAYVKPYVKTNKNDFNDAEAICEADSRPTMRYVTAKTVAQQDIQLLHRIRQRVVQQRTALVNQIRGQLLEYGIAIPTGISQVRSQLAGILEDGENELTPFARALFDSLRQELYSVDDRVKALDKKVKQLANEHPICQRINGYSWCRPDDCHSTHFSHW